MGSNIFKGQHIIDGNTRSLISDRYTRITRAVNRVFWNRIVTPLTVFMLVHMAVGQPLTPVTLMP